MRLSPHASLLPKLLLGKAAASSRVAPLAVGAVRDYRGPADPPVTLNFYRSQDGAPAATARYTAEGARAIERSLWRDEATRLGIFMNPGGVDIDESLRDDRLGPQGLRNFENVRRAVREQLTGTAEAILDGRKPIGIGGDHSMAAGTIPGTVLAVLVREVLRASAPVRPLDADRRLKLSGPEARSLRDRLVLAASAKDVTALGRTLDRAVDSGALSEPALWEFKHGFEVPWWDAHYDCNTPRVEGRGARVEFHPEQRDRPIALESPSPSGNFHGTPVSVAMGFGPPEVTRSVSRHLALPPSCFGFFGVRDADENEEKVLRALGVTSYSMDDLNQLGVRGSMDARLREAEARRKRFGLGRLFSIPQVDIDVLDASHVPITGTPVGRGSLRNTAEGPGLDATLEAMQGLIANPSTVAIDLAENAYDPRAKTHETLATGQRLLSKFLDLDSTQERRLFRSIGGAV